MDTVSADYDFSFTYEDFTETGQEYRRYTLNYEQKDQARAELSRLLPSVQADVILPNYELIITIDKARQIQRVTIPYVYGVMTYNAFEYNVNYSIQKPE